MMSILGIYSNKMSTFTQFEWVKFNMVYQRGEKAIIQKRSKEEPRRFIQVNLWATTVRQDYAGAPE